ncbi:MAG TPA: trypsin-like peptidase domain-containing protein [Solirubrobacteraceae bacterium]|nr:trypsin-like peptidase domain-containing protein [Solirubrobacteraceae bacterium]
MFDSRSSLKPWVSARVLVAAVLAFTSAALALSGCGGQPRSASTASAGAATTAAPSGAGAVAVEQQFVAVIKQTQPQVVQIQTDSGLGSGVIVDAKGNIVTNAHVVSGAAQLSVTLADGRRFDARLVGAYVPDDLAVVDIGSGHGIRPARFADSSKLAVGEIVLAEGNPLGLQSSVTDGIISALGRNVSEGQGVVLPSAIQTSAPINPGNSGGALIDVNGRVVGIPTLAAGNSQTGGAAAGIGFAIPSNTVTDIAGQIIRYGHVVNSHRAAIGASIASSTQPGALIVTVEPGGAASDAGVSAGDLIQRIDGSPIANASALGEALAAHRPGDKITLTILRPDGTTTSKSLTLGQLPGS